MSNIISSVSKFTSKTLIAASAPDEEALKVGVAKLRKTCVGKINTEQQKIDAATGRVESFFLRIGMLVGRFIDAAKTKGEAREDYLFKSIAKDEDCKVQKGALYNARYYYLTNRAMAEKFGKAPDVDMTFYIKARHKALTIDEQHDLLLKAESDRTMKASKLNALVAEKLKEKGFGRKGSSPDAALSALCNKAFTALTQVKGLLLKGIVPSPDAVFILGKTATMAAACLKAAGLADVQADALAPWDSGDAVPEREAP